MSTPASAFLARRDALLRSLGGSCALLPAGRPRSRNYPANRYPFRAESHFLYFVGRHLPEAALLFDEGGATLFTLPPCADDALWHGPREELSKLGQALSLETRPLSELPSVIARKKGEVATLPPNDDETAAWLSSLLGRRIEARSGAKISGQDAELAEKIIAKRLVHDEAAILELRQAASVTARAHLAGMRAARPGISESEVHAAMEREILAAGMTNAYGPIVTVHGEILHNEAHENRVGAHDLILADVGAETREGWAGDVTRTWPSSGRFSETQRVVYEVVLRAQEAAILRARPGVRYRDVHEAACLTLTEGLVDLGILRGRASDLVDRGAHALFFPHGVGHLLGLDVHDMEDLGDRAGYAPGRARSARFGDRYLRLDRDLAPGMAVTIEPGFYQVPAILSDPSLVDPFRGDIDWERLASFADVRGIRIEDDILITEGEAEVLTAAIPKTVEAVEAWMAGDGAASGDLD